MPLTAIDIERKMILYANAYYDDPGVSLHDASRQLGISERTIQRCLDACKNNWPSILTAVRMQEAHKLLTTTDQPIDAIAVEVGYLTTATFRKHFRHKYGTSPSKARKESRSRGAR